MYSVAANFHNVAIQDSPKTRIRIFFIDNTVDCTDDNDVQTNGTLLVNAVGDTDSNGRIAERGVVFNNYFNPDKNIQIGACVSSEVSMTLLNLDGALDNFTFGRCKIYLDVYDEENIAWLNCPMGVYLIEQPIGTVGKKIDIHGFDQMQLLDTEATWWNPNYWSAGRTSLTAMLDIFAHAADVPVKTESWMDDIYYSYSPFRKSNPTNREILEKVAEYAGAMAYFDRDGQLTMRWFTNAESGTAQVTYTGQSISIADGTGKTVDSLTVQITPTQNFNGYTKPWAGGAGKNLLQVTGRTAVTRGNILNTTPRDFSAPYAYIGITMNNYFDNGKISSYSITDKSISLTSAQKGYGIGLNVGVSPETTYTFSYKNKASSFAGVGYYDIDGNYLSYKQFTTGTWSFTTPANCVNLMVVLIPNANIDTLYDEPQLELGSLESSWVPYENICPISGLTGLSLYRTGKNLFDVDNTSIVTGYISGSFFYSGNDKAKTIYIPISPNTTYTVSKLAGQRFSIATAPTAPANAAPFSVKNANNTASSLTITSGAHDAFLWAWVYLQDTDMVSLGRMLASLQIELGSTATSYEPYNGNTYSVDWTTQAGTVYAGSIEVVGGTLKARPHYASYNGETLVGPWVSSMDEYAAGATPTTGAEVVDLGGSETTYQLTPMQISLLTGQNNIWASNSGILTAIVGELGLVTIDTDQIGNQCLSVDIANYSVEKFGKLTVSNGTLTADRTKTSVEYPTPKNAYLIYGNTFFDLLAPIPIVPNDQMNQILNKLWGITPYNPIQAKLVCDWSIDAGDIIQIKRNNVVYAFPIFQISMTWRGGYVVADATNDGDVVKPYTDSQNEQTKDAISQFIVNGGAGTVSTDLTFSPGESALVVISGAATVRTAAFIVYCGADGTILKRDISSGSAYSYVTSTPYTVTIKNSSHNNNSGLRISF